MALQARVAAIEAGRIRSRRQAVKDHALLGVKRGHFQQIAAANKSHHDVVAEVQRARIARIDPRRLEAGFRKHQHLGIGIHSQRLEQTRQIPIGAGGEVDFPTGQIPAEARDAVVDGPRIVLNRRMIDRNQGGLAKRLASRPAGHRFPKPAIVQSAAWHSSC